MSQKVFEYNCAIREQTAAGVSVGRCWFYEPGDVCPLHGDVSQVQKRYRDTGELTNEKHFRLTVQGGL